MNNVIPLPEDPWGGVHGKPSWPTEYMYHLNCYVLLELLRTTSQLLCITTTVYHLNCYVLLELLRTTSQLLCIT